MRIPLAALGLMLSLSLAACGTATDVQAQAQQPGPVPVLAAQTTAPGNLQWYADRATMPSDAPFAWQWFTAPNLSQFEQMREGTPGDLVTMTANLENSAYFEDLVSETGLILKNLRFFSDEVPCENCHQFDYVLVGELPNGTFGGFRSSVFWDH